jgi:hypothetical protein
LPIGVVESNARQTIERAHGKFVMEPSLTSGLGEDRPMVEAIVKQSLADAIHLAMLLATALALAGAACAAITIRTTDGRSSFGSAKTDKS